MGAAFRTSALRRSAPLAGGRAARRNFAKPGRIPSRQREPISARPLRAPVHAIRRTTCHLEPGPKPPPCRSPCETLSSAGRRSSACATSAICCNSGVAAGTRRAVASGLASAMHMPASTAALPRCPEADKEWLRGAIMATVKGAGSQDQRRAHSQDRRGDRRRAPCQADGPSGAGGTVAKHARCRGAGGPPCRRAGAARRTGAESRHCGQAHRNGGATGRRQTGQ